MSESLIMETICQLAIPFGTKESIDKLIKHAEKAQYVH